MIKIRNLQKSFPSHTKPVIQQPILRGIDLDVPRGGFLCILGTSGCGKSTLLNILAGLDGNYTGEVTIGGAPPRDPRTRVGYLFQEDRLLPWRTASQNVDFALRAAGVPQKEWQARKERYMALVGLAAYADHHPHQMSGGMRQRLSLVRALAIEPDLLLMDEPFSGLDELTARRLRIDITKIWAATGRTIVFVTHNSYEASFLADRIVIMAGGTIRETIDVTVPRPRDYDDPAIFDLNRGVVQRFMAVAEAATTLAPEPAANDDLIDALSLTTTE